MVKIMQQGVFSWKKLCNRVLQLLWNHATGCISKENFLRILSEKFIMHDLVKFLCERVYFWGVLYTKGAGCGETNHTLHHLPSQAPPTGVSTRDEIKQCKKL